MNAHKILGVPASETNTDTQSAIALSVVNIAAGTATGIACYGDSVTYGFLMGGTQANPTAPANLQAVLRNFFGNTAATVTNSGVSGNQTTNALRTWSASMAAETASIVYIAYGINDMQGANPSGASDPAISADQYAQNLRSMVRIARGAGKSVILMTPNPILPYGSLGTVLKAESVKQFAAACRQVAAELAVPLVDVFEWVNRYLSATSTPALTLFPDGLHPSQTVYSWLGRLMAMPLLTPGIQPVRGPDYFQTGQAVIRQSGGTNILSATPGSRIGYGRIANKIVAAFVVECGGLDIYAATPVWSSGSSSVTPVFDETSGTAFSVDDNELVNPFGVDQEVLIASNVVPGLHVVSLTGTGSTDTGFYYLRATPTRSRTSIGFSGGTAPTVSERIIEREALAFSGSHAGENQLLTDIPLSRTVAFELSFSSQLPKGCGVVLFCHRGSNGAATAVGGVLVYLDGTTGYLSCAERDGSAYTNVSAIGAADLSAASHDYRIAVATDGTLSLYVDGSLIDTYAQSASRPFIGGVLGLYSSAAASFEVRNVAVAQ